MVEAQARIGLEKLDEKANKKYDTTIKVEASP
jgi:hypothetical protein